MGISRPDGAKCSACHALGAQYAFDELRIIFQHHEHKPITGALAFLRSVQKPVHAGLRGCFVKGYPWVRAAEVPAFPSPVLIWLIPSIGTRPIVPT